MFIRIESSSGVSITRQIIDQIRAQCASGLLKPEDRLPSVRALAQELAVNQNTILRAYEKLTAGGLLERRHGDGTFVASKLPRGQRESQHSLLQKEVDRLVLRALTLGMTPEALHQSIDRAYQKAPMEELKRST